MYPTLSDLLKDLFNVNWPLPIQTFGFFVALSFLAAAYTLSIELRRKEKLGLLGTTTRLEWIGRPATFSELAFSALIGFVLGFKLVYFTLHYSELVEDPQGLLLSGRGHLGGGLALAAVMAWTKYRRHQKTRKVKPEQVTVVVHPAEQVSNLTMIAAIAGILGAKVFHNLEYPAAFMKDPVGELLSFSGLTMYGGLIVGAAAVLIYGFRNGLPPLALSDAAAPGLMLAYGVGRMGCQLSGDGDWGVVNTQPKPGWLSFLPDWAWSFHYPHNVINAGIPMPGCEGKHCMILEQPVFPTPLYESAVCIALFFVLWGFRSRLSVPGMMFFLYLLLNGVERFFIELIRVNPPVAGFEFTQAQLISTLLILVGVGGLAWLKRKSPNSSHA